MSANASGKLLVELVSPEKLVMKREAAMVVIPGGEGDYGVLPDHAPMITTVRAGVVGIYSSPDDVSPEKVFVEGGFAEVSGERCSVLANTAVPLADVDVKKLEDDISSLKSGMADMERATERAASEKRLAILQALLSSVKGG